MKDILQITAIFMLSNRKFNEWCDLSWKMRTAWLKWESNEIAPCMFGEFWYNGKKWLCDSTGIRKIADPNEVVLTN